MTSHSSEQSIPEESEEKTVSKPSQSILNAPSITSPQGSLNQPVDASFEVTLDSEDDPKQWSLPKKWFIVMLVCMGALCGTCASSMVCGTLLRFCAVS